MREQQQLKDLPRSKRQLPRTASPAGKSFRHQNRGMQVGRLNPK